MLSNENKFRVQGRLLFHHGTHSVKTECRNSVLFSTEARTANALSHSSHLVAIAAILPSPSAENHLSPNPKNKNILFRKAVSIPLLYPFLLNLYGFSPGITRLIDMRSATHGAVKKTAFHLTLCPNSVLMSKQTSR